MMDDPGRPFDEGGEDRSLWGALGAIDVRDEPVSGDFVGRVVSAARATPQEAAPRRWTPWARGGAAAAAVAAVAAVLLFAFTGGDPADPSPRSGGDGEDLAAVIRELEELPEEDVLALEAETAAQLDRDWLGG